MENYFVHCLGFTKFCNAKLYQFHSTKFLWSNFYLNRSYHVMVMLDLKYYDPSTKIIGVWIKCGNCKRYVYCSMNYKGGKDAISIFIKAMFFNMLVFTGYCNQIIDQDMILFRSFIIAFKMYLSIIQQYAQVWAALMLKIFCYGTSSQVSSDVSPNFYDIIYWMCFDYVSGGGGR